MWQTTSRDFQFKFTEWSFASGNVIGEYAAQCMIVVIASSGRSDVPIRILMFLETSEVFLCFDTLTLMLFIHV